MLAESARSWPAIFLTGPRQSGKTTLARATFPTWIYRSLEDPDQRRFAVDDPRGFCRSLAGAEGAIVDEAQRAPELFSYLQGFLDRRELGPVLLSGSQNFLLGAQVAQSLAGRARVLELLPLSHAEREGVAAREPAGVSLPWPLASAPGNLEETLLAGGYPAIAERGLPPGEWLGSYLRTYVERDVRALANVGDLLTFERFLGLCAGRAGQLLNLTALGADAGIDQSTARRWLSVLEASYVVYRLPPHFENFSKRLVKTPKLYFYDTGLLAHLLGVHGVEQLRTHAMRGALFENFVLGELTKVFWNAGTRAPLYFWRDQAGHEVDVLVDQGTSRLPMEVKSGATVATDWFEGLRWFQRLSGGPAGVLCYGGDESREQGGVSVQAWAGVGAGAATPPRTAK